MIAIVDGVFTDIQMKFWKKTINRSPDPADLTIENAYKTRWIWYHTILGILMFFANIIMLGIFILLAVKL